jgi:uncharacterized protein with von Willebrand factor type A (vWA) domain
MTLLAREHLEGFLDALAANGVATLIPRRVDFLRAVGLTPLRSIDDLYWAARVTLVSRQEEIAPFDHLFDAWFRSGQFEAIAAIDDESEESETERPASSPESAASFVKQGEGTGREASLDDLRNRRWLARASRDEREVWARMIETARRSLPRTSGRRRVRDRRRGTLDLRGTLAESRRTGGDIVHLRYQRRPQRGRRVLLLIDVSGSLKANSPAFLRFAHAIVQATARAEVFTFGTRLTRVTPMLRQPDLDAAMAALTPVINDFDGGTRIGETFTRFLSNSRFVSFARGALIIVLSDGLELGDPGPMAAATERLARLGHRLVWLTPMRGDPTYRPVTRGMRAVLGSLDRLGDGSSPAALLAELEGLPGLEHRPRRRAAVAWQEERRSA